MCNLSVFKNFNFDDIEDDWITSIWDSQFLTYNEVSNEYLLFMKSQDMDVLLRDSYNVIKNLLTQAKNNNQENPPKNISWQTLVDSNINVRCLLSILGYLIKDGKLDNADEDARHSCFQATSLYLILLAVPGSNAYNVFHPNLYEQAIETLKMVENLKMSVQKQKSLDLESLYRDVDNDVNFLTHSQKVTLIESLNCIMYDLINVIKSFWFKEQVQSLDITIRILLDVTKIEVDKTSVQFQLQPNKPSTASLCFNAYAALQELCDRKHGPIDLTIMLILKYMYPQFIFGHSDFQSKISTNNSDMCFRFLNIIQSFYESDATLAFTTFFQHLMTKCPDRLEGRQKQALLIVKLMSICQRDLLYEVLKNTIALSCHNKFLYRIFVQEIIAKLLVGGISCNSFITDITKERIKKTLFTTALSRCIDSSNMVRGRAMALFTECTDFSTDRYDFVDLIFSSTVTEKPLPTLEELQESLSDDELNILPSSDVVINLLMERIEDECAPVRRSAIHTFQNLSMKYPELTGRLFPLIAKRCRDPALSIRAFAIQSLSQILEKYHDVNEYVNIWVKFVLPQVSDSEATVQKKVLECLQELLLNKITHYSDQENTKINDLPWSIMSVIMSMKMRKYLALACKHWASSKLIRNTLQKNVQSHLNTRNDTLAWFFISILAENESLRDINQHFANYEELLQKDDIRTCIILQVYRSAWKSLPDEILKGLYLYLVDSLRKFKIDFSSIGTCIDIVGAVGEYLQTNDEEISVERDLSDLISFGEFQIERFLKGEENATEVAPIFIRVMNTLSHATFLNRTKISNSTQCILEGFLLEWELLPDIYKSIDELQTTTIVFLGQQAIRDRDLAQDVIPIFGQLLRRENSPNPTLEASVKVNVAKVLADLCIKFTALVDPYLSDMCISMKDPNPIVRETIVAIFIKLLLEDFIKIKGPFFFHILTMLSDTDETVRDLTVFLVEERLLVKNKTLIFQQFLESIYHYNNYRPRTKITARKIRQEEIKALTYPGKKNADKRRVIYDFMLEHLDNQKKFMLLVRLTNQIISGICNGIIDVRDPNGACILEDAIYILRNERLQVHSAADKNSDDQQEQEEVTSSVKTSRTDDLKAISENMKKYYIDVLLPLMMKVKKKLELIKSPLEGELDTFFYKIFSDYSKQQLTNLLNEYPELENEIDGRLRRGTKRASTQDEKNSNDDDDENACMEKIPRIVIRRLSSMTYSRITNLKSPSPILEDIIFSEPLTPKSSLSNTREVCRSSILSPETDLHSVPGPSYSTPRSSKVKRLNFTNDPVNE